MHYVSGYPDCQSICTKIRRRESLFKRVQRCRAITHILDMNLSDALRALLSCSCPSKAAHDHMENSPLGKAIVCPRAMERYPCAEIAKLQSPQRESRVQKVRSVLGCDYEGDRLYTPILMASARSMACPDSMGIERSPVTRASVQPNHAFVKHKLPTPVRLCIGRPEKLHCARSWGDEDALAGYSLHAILGQGAFGLVTRMSSVVTGAHPSR